MKLTAIRILTVLHVSRLCIGSCSNYLVSGPDGVPDEAISASTGFPACGRLYTGGSNIHSPGCTFPQFGSWCSNNPDPSPYIQVQFARLQRIIGVVVQQQHLMINTDSMLVTFKVIYSENGNDWSYASSSGSKILDASAELAVDVEKMVNFDLHVVARYVRIVPITTEDQTNVCLRFDVIGCKYAMEGKKQFEYTQLPEVAINRSGIISDTSAEDLGKCASRCHRDVTCQSFSYGNANKRCVGYRFNKCVQRINDNKMAIVANNDTLYFCNPDIDTPMTDYATGVTYKVVMEKSNQDDAVAGCAAMGMKLFVVDSEAKRDLLYKITYTSLILRSGNQKVRVGGGYSFLNGSWGWWDGNGKPLQHALVTIGNPTGTPCVVIFVLFRYIYTYECYESLYYICES